MTNSRSRRAVRRAAVTVALLVLWAAPLRGEQSVREVLAFLLTNRSIATGDFVRDELAASAASETIGELLVDELGTVPVTSSASGFTYRLDPTLGVSVRSSQSFGPMYVERSLTTGRGRGSVAVSYQATAYTAIDGRSLGDGTLVSTASRLDGEPAPFDIETVTLRIHTRSTLVSVNAGLSDRLDVGGVIPLARVSLEGIRLDTYRGTPFLQASGFAIASGLGDITVRGKFAVVSQGAGGIAVGADLRLPTGDEANLLGAGHATVTPMLIASFERGRTGVHGNVGATFGGRPREWQFRGAATIAAHPRVTLVGELIGRRPTAAVRLADTIDPHPTLGSVDTFRLTGVRGAAHRLLMVTAVRWNVASAWLVTASVMRPLTSGGLTSSWAPIVVLDYSFGR